MKKILILLLLLTSTLTLSATLYAWDLNDQPIPELNGLTLREVFEDSAISYPLISWQTVNNPIVTYPNNPMPPVIVTLTSDSDSDLIGIYKEFGTITNNQYYIVSHVERSRDFNITLRYDDYSISANNNDGYFSNKLEKSSNFLRVFIINGLENDNLTIHNIFEIDLTSLGIDNLTVQQMDSYYSQYISRKNANYDLDDSKATNVLTIMQDFQDILLGTEDKKGFVNYVDDFLFKERTVGFSIEWLGIYYEWKFKPFYLLGTTLFVTLMGLVFVKKFVPVA